jgi:hypothetical protein
MTVAPIVVYLLVWSGRDKHTGLFWAELTGVVFFALYWAAKSFELDRLDTQQKKLGGNPPLGGAPAPAPKTVLGKIDATVDAARHRAGRILEF